MTKPTSQPDNLEPADADLLELYLDGQLTGEAASQAELRIAQAPAMQQAVERQQVIDEGLHRQFAAPPVNADFLKQLAAADEINDETNDEAGADSGNPTVVVPSLPDDAPEVAPRASDNARERRMQLLAIAACLACMFVWGTFGWENLRELWSPSGGYELRTVAQVYTDAVDRGFEPDWLCKDDQEFAKTFAERQGQGLLLKPLPPKVRMAGLAYLDGLTPQSTSMMAYVDDQPVLIMVGRDKLISSTSLEKSDKDQVSIFQRKLGDLTAIEITPLDKPSLLNFLTLAEVPAEPTGHVPGTPYP